MLVRDLQIINHQLLQVMFIKFMHCAYNVTIISTCDDHSLIRFEMQCICKVHYNKTLLTAHMLLIRLEWKGLVTESDCISCGRLLEKVGCHGQCLFG